MTAPDGEQADPPSAPAPTDAAGKPLCSHAVWGRRCRWGKVCSFSHDVPPEVAARHRARAEAQTAKTNALWLASVPEVRVPPWLEEIHASPGAFRYDTTRWPLREAVARVLELASAEGLSELHSRPLAGEPPLCPTLLRAQACAHGVDALPATWRAALERGDKLGRASLQSSEAYTSFLELYRDFCAHVVVPLVGDSSAYVQEPPTLRVHLAGQAQARGRIGMHRDADYPNHCPAEVNFWVPMTEVGGSNSLFVESAPDRGDFRPLELRYGELYRFHGYGCRHHTAANVSGATRISFDLRAVPAACGPAEALRCSRRGHLRLGDYPAVLVEAAAGSAADAGEHV